MPLSEEEQRILQEIEKSFYESDPAFAREVSAATLSRSAARNCKLAAAGFLAGLVLLVVSFAEQTLIGFAGFIVMLGSAFVFQHNVRKLNRPGWTTNGSNRAAGVADALGTTRERVRDRLKRKRDED